jgi:glycosyltransferase involved in cell wall biosynthesis
MVPFLSRFDSEESGIKRVIEAWHKYKSDEIEYVECDIEDSNAYDLFAVHAGTTNRFPDDRPVVSHLHGLYWTDDYEAGLWEWRANANVIESVRRAASVTVPSLWVAETIKRDARIHPWVIPHGIEYKEWEHGHEPLSYVLWNKNRMADVCDPAPVGILGRKFANIHFITTFAHETDRLPNIEVIGTQPHLKMKVLIQRAAVYLSTTKETFGIGVLEALASGVPVLGFDHGGNQEIIRHAVNGYLARPGDYDDLGRGLEYCVKFRRILGNNARITARGWNWVEPVAQVERCYKAAYARWQDEKRPFQR